MINRIRNILTELNDVKSFINNDNNNNALIKIDYIIDDLIDLSNAVNNTKTHAEIFKLHIDEPYPFEDDEETFCSFHFSE